MEWEMTGYVVEVMNGDGYQNARRGRVSIGRRLAPIAAYLPITRMFRLQVM